MKPQKFTVELLSEKKITATQLENVILEGGLTPWNIMVKKFKLKGDGK